MTQTPISNGKPTEKVVIQYEKFVEDGAFLRADGWQRAGRLFEQVDVFPPNGTIYLTDTGGILAEDWRRGDEADVETKWTDYFGTIDPRLRYKAPPYDLPMAVSFRLAYSNKYREANRGGKVRELLGPWQWRIEGRMQRWTTVNKAIDYVTLMRQQTTDPVIRRNADRTLTALRKRMKGISGCGRNSAC